MGLRAQAQVLVLALSLKLIRQRGSFELSQCAKCHTCSHLLRAASVFSDCLLAVLEDTSVVATCYDESQCSLARTRDYLNQKHTLPISNLGRKLATLLLQR